MAENKDKKVRKPMNILGFAIGVCAGVVMGVLIGNATGDTVTWLITGLGLGVAIGAVLAMTLPASAYKTGKGTKFEQGFVPEKTHDSTQPTVHTTAPTSAVTVQPVPAEQKTV
jgi:hypothetical protein